MPACATSAKNTCLLYTSDAADERSSVDLGGRRIIKKKKIAKKKRHMKVNKNTIEDDTDISNDIENDATQRRSNNIHTILIQKNR